MPQEAQLVSVLGPADHLPGHQDVQQAEAQEVQEQEDSRWVIGQPVKGSGFDQQERNGHHSRDDSGVEVRPAAEASSLDDTSAMACLHIAATGHA